MTIDKHHPPRTRPMLILLFLPVLLTPLPAAPLALRYLPLDELAARSNIVVRGVVASARTVVVSGTPFTRYTLQVSETLAGPRRSVLVFSLPGGPGPGGLVLRVPGMPVIPIGREIVAFLTPAKGRLTLTGYALGLFDIRKDPASGKELLLPRIPPPKSSRNLLPAPPSSHRPTRDKLDYKSLREYLRSTPGLVGSLTNNDTPPPRQKHTNSPNPSHTKDTTATRDTPYSWAFYVPRGTWGLLAVLGAAALAAAGLAARRKLPGAAAVAGLLLASVALGFVREEVSGTPIYWPESSIPVPWEMNPDSTPQSDNELAAVSAGFQAWEDVPTSEIAFRYAGTPASENDAYDGHNVIFWTATDPKGYFSSPGILAITLYWADPLTGHIVDADIVFNDKDITWTTRAEGGTGYFIETVATHEIGHLLGLAHSEDPTATMYTYYHEDGDTLAQDDIDGVTAIYPDTTPPVKPVITTNGGADFTAYSPDLTLEGTMAPDTWELLVNGSAAGVAAFSPGETNWTYSTTLSQPDTVYTFEVTARDAAGNTSQPAVISVSYKPGWPVIRSLRLEDASSGNGSFSNFRDVRVSWDVSAESPPARYLLTEDPAWTPTKQDMLDFGSQTMPETFRLSDAEGQHVVYGWVMDSTDRISDPAEAAIYLDRVRPVMEKVRTASERALVVEFSEPVTAEAGAFSVTPPVSVEEVLPLAPERLYVGLGPDAVPGNYALSLNAEKVRDRAGNPAFEAPGAGAFTLDGAGLTASALQVDATRTLVMFSHEAANHLSPEDYRVAGSGFSAGEGLVPERVELLGERVVRLVHADVYQYLLASGYSAGDFPAVVPLSVRNVTDAGGREMEKNAPAGSPAWFEAPLLVEEVPSGDSVPPVVDSFVLRSFTGGSTAQTESRLVKVEAKVRDTGSEVIRWYLTEDPAVPAAQEIYNLGSFREPSDFVLGTALGVHTVYLYVMDAFGNTASASASIELTENQPPAAAVSVSPLSEDVPPDAVVTADATGSSDPEGGPVWAETDFGNGEAWEEGLLVSGTFSTVGTYGVRTFVRDAWGAETEHSETVSITTDTTPPTVSVPSFTLHGQVDTAAVAAVDIDGIAYPLSGGEFAAELTFPAGTHVFQITADDGVNAPTQVNLRTAKP